MLADIDLDLNDRWVSGPGTKDAERLVQFKRNTSADLRVRFWRAGVQVELDEDAVGTFGIKAKGEYDGDALVLAESWEKAGSGATTVYTFYPEFDGVALSTLLGSGDGNVSNDEDSVLCMCEIKWIADGKTHRTQTVDALIDNDVLKDGDGGAASSTRLWSPPLAMTSAPVNEFLAFSGTHSPALPNFPNSGIVEDRLAFGILSGAVEGTCQWMINVDGLDHDGFKITYSPDSGATTYEWYSLEAVATPDLVETWIPSSPATGSPAATRTGTLTAKAIGQEAVVTTYDPDDGVNGAGVREVWKATSLSTATSAATWQAPGISYQFVTTNGDGLGLHTLSLNSAGGVSGQLGIWSNAGYLCILTTSVSLTDNRIVFTPDADGELALSAITSQSTPATGATITSARIVDEAHYLTPAGTLATLTFALPSAANSRDQQRKNIVSTQTITALTVTPGSGNSMGGSTLTSMVAGTTYTFVYFAALTQWIRVIPG